MRCRSCWWSGRSSSRPVTALVFATTYGRGHRPQRVGHGWVRAGSGTLAFAVVGTVVAVRRPDNGDRLPFCANGLLLSPSSTWPVPSKPMASSRTRNPFPGAAWFGSISDALWVPFIAMTHGLPLPALPGRAARAARGVAWQPIGGVVRGRGGHSIGGLLEPHIYGLSDVANPLGTGFAGLSNGAIPTGFTVLLAVLVWSIWDLFRRLRRSTGEDRLQLRWFVYAAFLVLVVFIPSTMVSTAGLWWQVLGSLALITLPVAVGVAILKYRLYDIDVVVRRTVVFGALAAFITLVYVAIVVGLGSTVRRPPNGTSSCGSLPRRPSPLRSNPCANGCTASPNRLVYGDRASRTRASPDSANASPRPIPAKTSFRGWPASSPKGRAPSRRRSGCGWARRSR